MKISDTENDVLTQSVGIPADIRFNPVCMEDTCLLYNGEDFPIKMTDRNANSPLCRSNPPPHHQLFRWGGVLSCPHLTITSSFPIPLTKNAMPDRQNFLFRDHKKTMDAEYRQALPPQLLSPEQTSRGRRVRSPESEVAPSGYDIVITSSRYQGILPPDPWKKLQQHVVHGDLSSI